MLQTQLLRLSPKRPTSPTTPFTTNSTSNRPANAFVSLSCNYNAHPRLQPEAGSLHLPFEVETNLQLIEIKDHENKPRGWTSVFEGEQFIQTIAGGGSGASIALMRNTQDQLIIRKLQHGKAQKEAARAQNLESIGQAMLIGKEPTTSLPPKVQAIIRDKKKQLDQFVKQTRSEVTKRFVILNERQDQPNTYFACGYDQTAFANTNPNSQQLTAPEFAKAIQNKNNPLSPPRLQTLVQAQLNLTHLFQIAQF